jgi:hypothetical protein
LAVVTQKSRAQITQRKLVGFVVGETGVVIGEGCELVLMDRCEAGINYYFEETFTLILWAVSRVSFPALSTKAQLIGLIFFGFLK